MKCRICRSKTVKVSGLGNIAISDFTDKPKSGRKYPLNLVYCENCTLVQLEKLTPRNLLYKNYWYKSGTNPEVRKDLEEIAKYINKRKYAPLHIDIGANDGTLLNFSNALVKIAVDPSNIEPKVTAKRSFEWIQNYWENVNSAEADTITAIACLYDLPNPNKFVKNIKRHLHPKGIFIAEFEALTHMIESNDLGFICHEHVLYYSYKSLVTLFEKNGLEIFKVQEKSINGGSYRIFARHLKEGSIEFKEKEYSAQDIKHFFMRVVANRFALRGLFRSI